MGTDGDGKMRVSSKDTRERGQGHLTADRGEGRESTGCLQGIYRVDTG